MPSLFQKSMVVAVIAATLPATAAGARDDRGDRRTALIADLGLHVIGVGVQRQIGPRLAGQLALDLYDPWTQDEDFLGLSGEEHKGDVIGAVVRARLFFYPGAESYRGGWLSPFGQMGRGRGHTSEGDESGTVWAAGLSAGYSFLFADWFHLALGGGMQYHASRIPKSTFGRFYPTLDLIVGYVF